MTRYAKESINLEDIFEYCEKKSEERKHLKGYMYDSLIYRYKYAREKLAELEYKEQGIIGKDNSDYKTLKFYRDLANRDVVRFIQILDEAIGEHD